jgi:hypothetical protein
LFRGETLLDPAFNLGFFFRVSLLFLTGNKGGCDQDC